MAFERLRGGLDDRAQMVHGAPGAALQIGRSAKNRSAPRSMTASTTPSFDP
jgi:hypothetical protein